MYVCSTRVYISSLDSVSHYFQLILTDAVCYYVFLDAFCWDSVAYSSTVQ